MQRCAYSPASWGNAKLNDFTNLEIIHINVAQYLLVNCATLGVEYNYPHDYI